MGRRSKRFSKLGVLGCVVSLGFGSRVVQGLYTGFIRLHKGIWLLEELRKDFIGSLAFL